jgi:hypothetical protein
VAVAAGGSGTFASFDAEVTNSGNYFKTGTLLLHDTANGTTCASEDAANNHNTGGNCGTIFTVNAGAITVKTSYGVDFKNAGSLTSSNLAFWGSCAPDVASYSNSGLSFSTTGAGAAVTAIQTTGTLNFGLPVGSKLKIASSTYVVTTAVSVGATNPTISITSADTSALSNGAQIDGGIRFGTSANLCTAVKVEVGTVSGSGLDYTDGSYNCDWGCAGTTTLDDLNSLPTTSPTWQTLASSAMAAGAQSHVIVTITPPAAGPVDNTVQNQKADVSLTWHVDEA